MSQIKKRFNQTREIIILLMMGCILLSNNYAAKMNVATWLSPDDPQNAIVLVTWKKWIEEATDGQVKVELKYHQGHPKDIFGEVEDGNYDAGWSYHGYLPGKFKLTVMSELPLLGAGPEAASRAYWKVHKKYLAKANEHRGLTLAALFLHGPGQIMMREKINSLSDLKNKKIRVGGGVQGLIAEKLGVVAVPAPGSKVYEILSQGIADGIFMPIKQQAFSRLSEVTTFVYEVSEGMYLGSFAIFINPDFMDQIGKKNTRAIMKVSGEKLSAFAGKVWAEGDQTGYDVAQKDGVKIIEWSSSDKRKFKRIAAKIEKKWINDVKKESKVNVKKALREYRALARKYQKENN